MSYLDRDNHYVCKKKNRNMNYDKLRAVVMLMYTDNPEVFGACYKIATTDSGVSIVTYMKMWGEFYDEQFVEKRREYARRQQIRYREKQKRYREQLKEERERSGRRSEEGDKAPSPVNPEA